MSKFNNRDYLQVVWKDSNTRQTFVVAQLTRNGKYEFIYLKENLPRAEKFGFQPLVAFPDVNKKYINDDLFPVIESRLPDKRRKDISKILESYCLSEYDAFELLRHSGGKLPIDNIQFVDPIFLDSGKEIIERDFYVAGTRYYDLCMTGNPENCVMNGNVKVGDELELVHEPENEYDENAVEVYLNKGNRIKIGYVPKYFSNAIKQAIEDQMTIECYVMKIAIGDCQECVKVKVKISL